MKLNHMRPDAKGVWETKATIVTRMRKKNINRKLNILNLFISISVFGTGLILFTQFHMGEGAYREELLGLEKKLWLTVHQVSAIGFLVGFATHLQMHWKYIKIVTKRWRISLPKKIKSRTREQILLFVVTLVVAWAGFYPWIAMPGATLEVAEYHDWIDVHNRVGIFLVIGMAVHIVRRRGRLFGFMKKNHELKSNAFREQADR